MSHQTNWTIVTESNFAWERDALEFIKSRFPDHAPFLAWSNFEFIATDGSINEVDLLVFTPQGFFLIEIKSRPGRLTGDPGTWTWETNSKPFTYDNPLYGANRKAKKLRSLLERQRAFSRKGKVPYVEPLIFCSAEDLKLDLIGIARQRVCLRDREQEGETPARHGIMAAILRRECPGLEPSPRTPHDRPTARLVAQAMEQAGIRPSQKYRKVGDYELDRVIDEGPGYQDWEATHTQLKNTKRRVRIYLVRQEASADDRQTIERAAEREFQILETLQHQGVLRTYGFTSYELGPALILEHDPQALRLDHYLIQRKDTLSVDIRLDLMRQIAEVMRFAHEKRVIHRGLCPQSILVTEHQKGKPQIKVFSWQLGYRAGSSTPGRSQEVTATSHIDRLVDDIRTAYMAPEALSETDFIGEHLDIFSLGAIAFHLFAGQPPAVNGLELNEKLRDTQGLQISAVLNGTPASLQTLIQESTHPVVDYRTELVAGFLNELDQVEEELTAPEPEFMDNPNDAKQGDSLPGGFTILKRLGQGATSIVFLVERDGQEFVLKVANDPEHNERLQSESETLQKLRHPNIVEFCGLAQIGNRVAFLMQPVLVQKKKGDRQVETLSQRLRREGRLHIDLLQRFGEDLLSAVNYLDEQGANHRDIKPDNVVIGQVGRGDKLHLVLFDFSLSKTPLDNIRAGTTGYLDPMLPLRNPPRWDLPAERYAAAVTLYEMATGILPVWGDGKTDPTHLDCEVTIDPELFDVSLRDTLTDFFSQAFQREPTERFDNAEDMLRAWRHCFEGIEEPGLLLAPENEAELRDLLSGAIHETPILELGLGTRATNALDRFNILTVADLLKTPARKLQRLRGIGHQTRREILTATRLLRNQLGTPLLSDLGNVGTLEDETDTPVDAIDPGKLSVDSLIQRVTRLSKKDEDSLRPTLEALLGLDDHFQDAWPTSDEIARHVQLVRKRTAECVGKLQQRWSREPAVTRLRHDLLDILKRAGGVMSEAELAIAILIARGSIQDDQQIRTRWARAALRAAVEVEGTMVKPRFVMERQGDRILVAQTTELANYAFELGNVADEIADEDPLLSPDRTIQRLQAVKLEPESVTAEDLSAEAIVFPETQLLRLAAAASRHAAVSSRQEIYPRGMAADRALRLSQGALYGVKMLTVEQIRERVSSRYPEAAPLPSRPRLDQWVSEVVPELVWDQTANHHQGCYVSRAREGGTMTSNSAMSRWSTTTGTLEMQEVTPEIADARQFEERLQRSVKEGAFLALLVHPTRYQKAMEELCHRFPLKRVDFEGLLIDRLQQVAAKAKVKWDLVLQTDATPHQGDWDKLMLLVDRAMVAVEAELSSADQTILLIYPGLLARYNQMTLLERLREKVGRTDGIPGLWVLLPNDQQALIAGKAVPLLSPGQRARIPEGWLENKHRANGRSRV
ncbi:BREX system serine/threonine kinase PglW [Egbenema bharatensis]|uniref:BREX system serine/threonine kinase PglW n=1 Tax=Egbenema bharatensis TaxID=3463334 RepID=UPI003A8486C0